MSLEGNSSDNDTDIQGISEEQTWTDLTQKNNVGQQAEGVKTRAQTGKEVAGK